MAHIVAVCRSERRAAPKEDVGAGELRAKYGLVGDANAGNSDWEVSLLALESIERANQTYRIAAAAGCFGENLTTSGIDLLSLVAGDLLRVGPALLEVIGAGRTPPVADSHDFCGISLLSTKGVFCRVLEGGRVERRDDIAVVLRRQRQGVCFRTIGYVLSDFSRSAPPEQIRAHESRIVVEEDFVEGLAGLQAESKLTVVFHFHLSQGFELLQHPRGDPSRRKRGVFALCSPHRPNPIGVSFVDLISRQGRLLVVRGLDALNGTPVLDIKPFFLPEI